MQTTVSGGSEDYTVHVLATDLSMADFKNAVTVLRDASPHDFYHKHRVVSTGIRFFKTSLSDTESGQLDMHYSRDGASIDDSTNLRTLFGRPTSDTRRLYLAGHHEALRG
jgi:nicotinate-nucleotide pyrophosphorylase